MVKLPVFVRIRTRLFKLQRRCPPGKRDRWYYEEVEELAAKLSTEKQRRQDNTHIGCQLWLPPWHEECKEYDV
jgi:hypothetical protein